MQNEYLVYTAIANLQTELRTQLKQVAQLLEEIRDLMVAQNIRITRPEQPQARPVVVDQERQSV